MARITVNGKSYKIGVHPETPLLWILRDRLGLKGTKYGCGVGICGVCMVLIEGEAQHACMVTLEKLGDRRVTTIEGLAQEHHPLLRAWIEEQVPQCGYCQPAQIVAGAALLKKTATPAPAQLDDAMSAVLCRCGTYLRIRRVMGRRHGDAPASGGNTLAPTCPAPPPDEGVALNPWLRIHGDNTVTLVINFTEMGQGVVTSLAMLVSEELEVDLSRVRTVFAPVAKEYVNPRFGVQLTGGSTAVSSQWEQLRKAGAGARMRLIKAAAARWRARIGDCRAELGSVLHAPSGRRLAYAALAAAASKIPPPKRMKLKPRSQWKLLGKPTPRLDLADMVRGRTVYGIDVSLPGMLVASVERSPALGAEVRRVDAAHTRAVPDIHAVHRIDSGVAVVADDAYAALCGRRALQVDWTAPAHTLNTRAIYDTLHAATRVPGKVVYRRGDWRHAFAKAQPRIEAAYRTAFLAHTTLEPMNCIAHVRDHRCDVWVGTQSQTDTQKTAARLTGLPRRQVFVHSQFCGGGFGRRLETDVVTDAVQLAQKIRRPVQVMWTRRDDLQHDFYRPAHCTSLVAALDAEGLPTAVRLRAAGPELALEMIDIPYRIPRLRIEHRRVDYAVPTGAWRSVGAGQNAFVVESFIDELAHAAHQDPFEYRRRLLEPDSRYRKVLELAAQESGWAGALSAGEGRGIAVYRSFGSYVAEVAEVVVADDRIEVQRVVCAIDCGAVVNPDTVRAQIEGAIAQGVSAALYEEVRIENGQILHANFEDYPILTFAHMPEVEVHIVDSDQAPSGVGEPGLPPVAPAIANAVYAATRRRLRALPLRMLDPYEKR